MYAGDGSRKVPLDRCRLTASVSKHLDSPRRDIHDAWMRPKPTLDANLAKQLQDRSPDSVPRFELKAKACGFRSGVDVRRLNQVNDQLEIEGF
jgi:hypothetical protein